MVNSPTYDDVNLILRLYEMRREKKLRLARKWFTSEFKARTMEDFLKVCPLGSEESAYFRMVVSYWEMVASFVTNGVLNQELFLQSGLELLAVWERIRDLVTLQRAANTNPGAYKNLEAVAKAASEYLKRQGPEAYEAFSARMRG